MKSFLFTLITLTVLSCSPVIPRFDSTHISAASILENIRNEGIVVRVATQGRKVQFYRQRLSSPDISESLRQDYEKLLVKALEEDQEYLTILTEGFEKKYTFSHVCFIPDSLFKSFLEGKEGRCMQLRTGNIDAPWPKDRRAMLAAKMDRDDLVLVTINGERLPDPLPYRKYTWFPVFRKVFQRKKYIQDQIEWFQSKLENQYIAAQIQLKKS